MGSYVFVAFLYLCLATALGTIFVLELSEWLEDHDPKTRARIQLFFCPFAWLLWPLSWIGVVLYLLVRFVIRLARQAFPKEDR